MQTAEELIEKINALGFQVNNLFQFDGLWRCNLRSEDDQCFTNFTQGNGIIEALEKALYWAEIEAQKRKVLPPITKPPANVSEDLY